MVKLSRFLAYRTSLLMKSLNKTQSSKRNLWLIAIVSVFLSVFISSPVLAQNDKKKESRKTKQTVAMSQPVYESLLEIQELVEIENFTEAQAKINSIQTRKKLSPYETAQIWNISGYSYYLQENYPKAIEAYENVLAQPELPEALQQSTLKTLAQLQFTIEDYPGALKMIRRLMAVVAEPAADVYMLLGQAHFQMQNYQEAISPITTAINMFKDQGRVPRENWLLLLRVCYWELKDFPNMLIVLEELIEAYPKDSYILTLAGVHSELGDTKKQLALVEALYEGGYVDGKQHSVNLANLYLLHGVPVKGAQVLAKELAAENIKADVRNLRLLSQAWYSAREDRKAIPPLKQAAEISDDGELYIRLAQSYINLEMWSEASESAKKGLSLGGLKRNDQANIMLGMALFNQKKFSQARRAFQAAGKDNRSKRASQQWIRYVNSEIRRRDTLEQKLPEMQAREIDDILKANMPPDGN